jgi:hypothetical protein
MPLQGTPQKAKQGLQVFDVNQPLTALEAQAFKEAGFAGCVRYLPRTSALMSGNLTYEEAAIILGTGLSLSAVQHCPLDNWLPTPELGTQYGSFAASYAKKTVGLPEGIVLWLDLEMVSKAATTEDVLGYCDAWYTNVLAEGFIPGLYIGWQPGASMLDLSHNTRFQHYWRGYNADPLPGRGYQLIQHDQKELNGIAYDPSTTQNDNLLDSLVWLAPK